MSKETSGTTSGIGLAFALFLIFLVLKLLDKITWSWWWVTSPLWIPLCIMMIIALLILVAGKK